MISTFNDYRNDIEEELNFDLSKPYILCQTGWRKHIGISKTEIDYEKICYCGAKKKRYFLIKKINRLISTKMLID